MVDEKEPDVCPRSVEIVSRFEPMRRLVLPCLSIESWIHSGMLEASIPKNEPVYRFILSLLEYAWF
jgi:hypothetical protein